MKVDPSPLTYLEAWMRNAPKSEALKLYEQAIENARHDPRWADSAKLADQILFERGINKHPT